MLRVLPRVIIYKNSPKSGRDKVTIIRVRASNIYDDVIYLFQKTNLAISKLTSLPFFKHFGKELLNLIVFKV